MGESTQGQLERLKLDDILARVERQQAETRKFVAEHGKLTTEQNKLVAESLKLHRDRWLAPFITGATAAGAVAAAIAAFAALMRH